MMRTQKAALWTLCASLLGSAQGLSAAATQPSVDGTSKPFSLRGSATRSSAPTNTSSGGAWTLSGDINNSIPSDPDALATANGVAFVGERQSNTSGAPDCLCGGLIFADGFESGNTDAWSSTTP